MWGFQESAPEAAAQNWGLPGTLQHPERWRIPEAILNPKPKAHAQRFQGPK